MRFEFSAHFTVLCKRNNGEDYTSELKGMLNGLRDELKQHVTVQLEHQRKEFQHFVGVMTEDFHGKLQLVGEGHLGGF